MLYSITKPWAKVALATYFRKIHLSGLENVPQGKPVILACNHPTAFIEPCILACWLPQQLGFLERGDLYLNKPLIRRIYDAYGMIPVFRIDDAGYGNLKNNFDSFARVHEALRHNRTVMILAEGRVKHEKRLRPLMKGAARLAFGTVEKFGGLDIHIVPVGINYTDSDRFRSEVMIDFGAPVLVRDYLDLHRENPARAVTTLMAEIGKRLKEQVVHIQNPKDDSLTERLLEMRRNEMPSPVLPVASDERGFLLAEKQVADRVNHLPEEAKSRLFEKLNRYRAALKSAGATDRGVLHPKKSAWLGGMLAALGLLPAALGYALNFQPLWLGWLLSKRIAKAIEFRASVGVFLSGFLWTVYFLALLAGAVFSGKTWVVLTVFLLPALGWFYLIYKELAEKWWESARAGRLPQERLADLKALRAEVVKALHEKKAAAAAGIES